MADNTGIPFNLLTDEEVEELFHTVSDPSGLEAVDKAAAEGKSLLPVSNLTIDHTCRPDEPAGTFNYPVGGNAPAGFERVGMGRDYPNEKQEDIVIPYEVAKTLLKYDSAKQQILDTATKKNELNFGDHEGNPVIDFHFGQGGFIPGFLNFSDENGYPTCHTEKCGYCRKCVLLGRLPKAKVTIAGANLGATIPWNEDVMQGVLQQRGGFRRGELSAIISSPPHFGGPRTGSFLLNSPFLYGGRSESKYGKIIYNLEEGWDSIIGQLMTSINSKGLDYIKSLTRIPQTHHQVSDIEMRGDGSVVASYITSNQRVNVGTVGHVDIPQPGSPCGAVISVSNAGVTVGGKLVYKFRALPAKHYFAGDYMGDSMSRNGRYDVVPIDSHYFAPVITAPKKPKAKREQWAQDAVDQMILNDYLGNSDTVVVGRLQATVLHNAKRALKNKGLDKETPSLKDLFAKHGKS